MNTTKPLARAACIGLLLGTNIGFAITLPPPPRPNPPVLDYWSFSNTNTWASQYGYVPILFTNLGASTLGDGMAVVLDSPDPAWLQYNIFENDGTTNLALDSGGFTLWVAPNWAGTNEGGTGPGEWGRLIEVGSYTPDASYGWWSLYTDPDGVNLYFSAQDGYGNGAIYLSAPVDWTSNRWHMVGLSYCSTGSVLYLDGAAVTNGLPITVWPSLDVQSNGFCIGSDLATGTAQVHAMFDDLHTYGSPLNPTTLGLSFDLFGAVFYGNPANAANISQAPSSPQITPTFDAVTGPGYLQNLGTVSGCVVSSNVWFTNIVATMATNGTMNLTFSIVGGWNGQNGPFDLFANPRLGPTNSPGYQWVWMGQGYSCNRYLVTNLPPSSGFFVLGTPQDSDQDGLTDAYELLVSKTNPLLWDTDGDGVSDGVEVGIGTDPLHYDERSSLALPGVGSSYLRILAPDLLEMVRVSADTSTWNFVTNVATVQTNIVGGATNYVTNFVAVADLPSTNQFQVKSDASSIAVTQVGFKRRPLYAPIAQYDLRIENTLYLRLASTNWASSNATIEVTTTNTALWPVTMRFVSVNNPLRYGPTIHVTQAGYLPTCQKKAMIGYYLGSLGEMQVSTNLGFKVVDATGAQVYPTLGLASLIPRPDDPSSWGTIGTNPVPQYQMVLEADFTGFTNAGQYQLVVPGLGASYPFRIDQGSMMNLVRTYALGLYHQRCGGGPDGLQVNDPQFTRFSHANCHTNHVSVPLPTASYQDTWSIMSDNYGSVTYTFNLDNPPQLAPPVTNYSAFLFPYSNNPVQGIDVSGGHHDAGDYSKYTLNSAMLVHILTFAADNLGLTNFDNFGIPESTNGIPDILDEAKWEADFLAKMQDSDGGFYFLVYPRDLEYDDNGNVLPQYGDPQIVWPKTTAATAAAVGALAEIGSSPAFNAVASYRTAATNYLMAATNGWKFLTSAIAKYGKDGCYQRITHYGDDFTHDDELAWAAASLFAATGDTNYQAKLLKWFPNPADTNGHNGFTFKRYDSTNSFPATSNLFVALAYVPDTNSVTTTTNTIWFKIWDAEGSNVVNQSEASIPHISDIPAVSNKLYDLKTSLNANPDSLFLPSALDKISALVGNCHATWWSGWWRCFFGYGCAVRDYAFAARSGRLSTNALNSAYLAQCETEILARATNVRTWSTNNAYGTSLDPYTKNRYSPVFYFAGDRTFDLAVADRIQPDPANTNAIIENLNYEAGRNPLNLSRITGLGWYRQREIVDQFSQNNYLAILPKSGVPLGNISQTLGFTMLYGNMDTICFPATSPAGSDSYALYDRWAEVHNVNTEFVHPDTARALVAAAYLVTSATLRTQVWRSGTASIIFTNSPPPLNGQRVAQLGTTQDLSGAQIVWDPGRAPWNFYGQQPAFGTFTLIATNIGDPPLQAEVVLPDGRRLFAVTNLQIWNPTSGGAAFTNDSNTVALYHFDDAAPGNLGTDSSGHGYKLNAYGQAHAWYNPNWMASPTGYVASFAGVSDYLDVQIPTSELPLTTNLSFTVDAWIYPRAYKTDDAGNSQEIVSLFQQYNSASDAADWILFYTSALTPDAPQLYVNGPVMLSNTNLNQYLPLNTWHQLKITFGSGTTSAYIDGALRGTSTNPPTFNPSAAWTLTLGHFDGDIDEVRISNKVRP